jgi:transaldolase
MSTGKTKLAALADLGQGVWMDYIQRGLIRGGQLAEMVRNDCLSGVTSNPAIFEKAITGSTDYDDDIRRLVQQGKTAEQIYQSLAVQDVQEATDVLREVYDKSGGKDGFVSLEVSPHLAYETDRTIAEARDLWHKVNRPNLLVKIPATLPGLPAIRQCLSEGININITLLFSVSRYDRVAEAYLEGVEALATRGQKPDRIASVASFFLSRIDVLIDPLLDQAQKEGRNAALAKALQGQAGVACAKLAYQTYKKIVSGGRFQKLSALGARVQRLLWASTSTKNPTYSDTMYVEPLIGPDTVNTMPLETLQAYRDHGQPAVRIEEGLDRAGQLPDQLKTFGIDLEKVADQLEQEGVQKFIKPYDSLIAKLREKLTRRNNIRHQDTRTQSE